MNAHGHYLDPRYIAVGRDYVIQAGIARMVEEEMIESPLGRILRRQYEAEHRARLEKAMTNVGKQATRFIRDRLREASFTRKVLPPIL